jgi:hypothetical protein
MNQTATKAEKRAIRRAFGDDALESYVSMMRRLTALEQLVSRGIFGRLWWLLTGR